MNKILEAIQKGVQLGLEIQDNELNQSTFQKSEITSGYHTDRANQLRWLRDNFVDLGLPSRTLWCKYNLGATNGDTPESWYGNYYAWGETTVKDTYDEQSYKFDFNKPVKYNDNDAMYRLTQEDDVVSITMGNAFSMPTSEDIKELASLPSVYVKDYNGINHLNGKIFTGLNGNKLFIPAAGYIGCGGKTYCESSGYLWSSDTRPDRNNVATDLYFNQFNAKNHSSEDYRYFGIPIRAVLHK